MSRSRETHVKVGELKAKLSAYLRAARSGRTVVVHDRETPVARLVPLGDSGATLPSRPAVRPWGSAPTPTVSRVVDSLGALLVERRERQ